MPILTPHYNLEAFTWGDIYSSSSDKRRFRTIDSQLALITDIIGGGIISGWDLSVFNLGARLISVNPGMGIIGRRVILTYDDIIFEVDNNSTNYIYMKDLTGLVGGFSGYSNIVSVTASITSLPAAPSGLQEVVALNSYDQIGLTWGANVEPDFSYYKIYRVQYFDEYDLPIFEEVTDTTETSCLDTGLESDTLYTYQVIAVNQSGLESLPAEITVQTALDDRIPASPLFLQVYPDYESLQIVWDYSPSFNVVNYRIEVQLLDDNYNVDGDSINYTISAESGEEFDSNYLVVENLDDYRYYRVTVIAITSQGIESEGISVISRPKFNEGAGEVENVVVEFEQSEFDNIGIETDISWAYQPDPYIFSFAEKFRIIFIENSRRVSEPIDVLESETGSADSIEYSTHIQLIPFLDNGNLIYESLKEYTPYLIMIQTIDEQERISNGRIIRINRTPTYDLLTPVTDTDISRNQDNSLTVSWNNPVSRFFNYNLLTVSILDLGTNDVEWLLNGENVGSSTTYIIPSDKFGDNKRYDVTIRPVDIFDRAGQSVSIFEQFVDEEETPRPDPPTNINISVGDREVILDWDVKESNDIASYKIYRALDKTFIFPNEFSVIATVSSVRVKFNDYNVDNGTTYAYLVTSVDIYGNESTNPVDDNLVPLVILKGTPVVSTIFTIPENLIINPISTHNILLEWDLDVTSFDGYQILRSVGNSYSFEIIGSVSSVDTTYQDNNALLQNEQIYYYMIRKFRNEGLIETSQSAVPPVNSILIGTVAASTLLGEQVIVLDDSLAVDLENFEEPLRGITNTQVLVHKHVFSQGIDKRIELRTDSTVANWQTNDFVVYTTTTDIEGASSYVVTIQGVVNEDYFVINGITDFAAIRLAQAGIAPILYEVDGEQGTITFRDPLYTTCVEPDPDPANPNAPPVCPSVPYLTEPTLSLRLVNISETQKNLPQSKIESLSATQFTSGELATMQMPPVRHEGRINEDLIPLRLETKTKDNFVYSLFDTYVDNDRNKMGNAVAFYDVIPVGEDDKLLAATSSGVWFSETAGSNWVQKSTFDSPVHKLFRSSENKYFAITNYGIYLHEGSTFSSWKQMEGLDFVKVIRDIVEDNAGNIYISTDLGVFRLNKNKPYVEDRWEQTSIFGVRSSEAYGLNYDSVNDALLVGNELGLLESFSGGDSWAYTVDLPDFNKIISFFEARGILFALADDKVYRRQSGGLFIEIAVLNVSLSRSFAIFDDVIYVGTDAGPKSSGSADIYSDVDIDFVVVWPVISVKNKPVVVTSLNVIGNNLYVGTDRRLFLLEENDKMWTQYEQRETVIPSVYVDNNLQTLGFYYNNGGISQNISFDEIRDINQIVQISNKYDMYITEFKGWAEQKYDASFTVYSNDSIFAQSTDSIIINTNEFLNFQFPTYDDLNSNEETATEYQEIVEDDISIITGANLPTGEELTTLISKTYRDIEFFLSQIYKDARIITTTDSDGNVQTSLVSLPCIDVSLVAKSISVSNTGQLVTSETDTGATVNVVSGVFNFDKVFDKYDSLKLDVYDCTLKNAGQLSHREIENSLELMNSGLPSSLSQVQQVNINKVGIFTEKTWDRSDSDISQPYQSKYIIPLDNDSWFDETNSTITYTEEVFETDLSFSLTYATSVLLVTEINKVFVGGNGGVLSIDTNTFEIEEIEIDDVSNKTVKQIFREADNIYVLTDQNLYMSNIYSSYWEEINRLGLPSNLYSISAISNNLIVGASDGIYYKSSTELTWSKAINSIRPVEIVTNPDLLFAAIYREEKDKLYNDVYVTGDGYNFTKMDISDIEDLDVSDFNINEIAKYRSTVFIATKQGLYTDNGSFYSKVPRLYLVEIEETGSESLSINDIGVDADRMVVGVDTGDYYIMENDVFDLKSFTSLDSIQKIVMVNGEPWVFGYNAVKVPDIDYPIRLTTGVPM